MRSIEEAQADLVAQARQWVGTPYRHQGMVLGQMVDCVGLIIAAGVGAGVLEMSDEAWEPFKGYGRTPNPHKMDQAMRAFLVPLELEPQPEELPADGAVMWMGWRQHLPMHLGILATADDGTGRRTMIHAYEHVGRCVEHGFAAEWPGRVISWWAYPGLVA